MVGWSANGIALQAKCQQELVPLVASLRVAIGIGEFFGKKKCGHAENSTERSQCDIEDFQEVNSLFMTRESVRSLSSGAPVDSNVLWAAFCPVSRRFESSSRLRC